MTTRTFRRPVIVGAALLALGGAGAAAAVAGEEGGQSAQQGGNRYVVGAWLDAGQEVPTPVGVSDRAAGKFSATLRRRGRNWEGTGRLSYRQLTGPAQAAHIHVGMKGVAGPVEIALCGATGTPDCRNGVRMPISLTNAQLNALKRGDYYVNVHTERNGPGEIRGQMGIVYRLNATLNTGQERPRPSGPRRGNGRFVGTLVAYGNSGHLDARLTYRRLNGPAQAAHIHRGPRGRTGPVGVTLCGGQGVPDCRSGLGIGTRVGDDVEVSGATLRALLRGRTYVNVHTQRNPAGEIRGQIRARR